MSRFRLRDFEAFAFDYDGVLADSVKTHTAARLRAYDQAFLNTGDLRFVVSDEIHQEAHRHGSNPRSINAWILHQAGILDNPKMVDHEAVDLITANKKIHFEELAREGHDEIRGATDFAKRVAIHTPHKVGIVTTAHRWEVEPFLIRYRLEDYFPPRHIVTSDDCAALKPDPSAYEMFIDRAKVKDPAGMLVFEDTDFGIQAAKTAGATVVALATTFPVSELEGLEGLQAPDYIAADFAELHNMAI